MRQTLFTLLTGIVLGGGLVALIRPPPPPAVVPGPSPAELALDREIGDLPVERLQLEEALVRIGKAANVEIAPDWPALEAAGHTRSQLVSLPTNRPPLNQALAMVLPPLNPGIAHLPIGNRIVLTTEERASGSEMFVRAYPVADLLGPEIAVQPSAEPGGSGTGTFGGSPRSPREKRVDDLQQLLVQQAPIWEASTSSSTTPSRFI